MNKKKIGALLGVLSLGGLLAFSQIYHFDQIWASYGSQDFSKEEQKYELVDEDESYYEEKDSASADDDLLIVDGKPIFGGKEAEMEDEGKKSSEALPSSDEKSKDEETEDKESSEEKDPSEEKDQSEEEGKDPSEEKDQSEEEEKDSPEEKNQSEEAGKEEEREEPEAPSKEKDFLDQALLNKSEEGNFTGEVCVGAANIRALPSLDSNYLGALKEGDMVSGNLKDGWLEMEIGGEPCYVSEKCIRALEGEELEELEKKELDERLDEISADAKAAQKAEDERKERSTPKAYQGYVQFKEASIMDGPSEDAKLIDNIKLNTLVKGQLRDGWVKFTYKGKDAYISENFVDKNKVVIKKPKPVVKKSPKKAQSAPQKGKVNLPQKTQKKTQNSLVLKKNSGAVWPLAGHHFVSYGIGPRWGSYHYGIDVPCPVGSPVKAIKGGKVVRASWYGGYGGGGGNTVIIQQEDGYLCKYMHLSSIQVRQGQTISGGSSIGLSGNTGFSTGPHLHIELSKGGRVYDARVLYGI